MTDDEKLAAAGVRVTEVLAEVLGEDPIAIASVLGGVVGAYSLACEQPARFLATTVRVAQGIISGDLLK